MLAALLGCGHERERAARDWTIVFQSDRDGEWTTHAVGLDGTGRVRVAPSDGPAAGPPVASPDGTQAVLPGANELRLVRAGEPGWRRLAGGLPSTAAWSPDGKRIAFVGLSPGISVIDADGENGRRLTRNRGDGNPAWSPDGKTIAFTRNGVGVLVTDPGERGWRVLSREQATAVRWSRDGRSLVFVTGYYGADVFTVSASTGLIRRRVRDVPADEPIALSRDGRWIAYRRWPHLFVMRTDGTQRRRVARGSEPAWSPDGRSLAYAGHAVGHSLQVFVVRRDGGGKRRLTDPYPNGGDATQPGWMRGPLVDSPSPYRLKQRTRPEGASLELPYPVVTIGAAGSVAVLAAPPRYWSTVWVVAPPLVLWDPVRNRLARVARPSCNETASVAVLRRHVAFDCAGGHAASFGRSIALFRPDRPRPTEVASGWIGEGDQRSSLPGRVAGGDDLAVFSRTPVRGWRQTGAPRSLWGVRGGRLELLLSGPDAGEPAAVAAGRIAVERIDGVVTLLTTTGRVLGRIRAGRSPPPKDFAEARRPTVALTREHVVVLRSGRLAVFDAGSLRRVRAAPVPAGARLAGAARGLAAFVAGGDVHVVRLGDGRATVFRTGGRGVDARVTSAGLFYVAHGRRVRRYESRPFVRNPARVVFVRRAALLRRLRTSR